ncbi:MAG: very short patch repair endonuclease [Chloroflexota bacterium]|nr:very short patch repair endonuclease [Chloroflexota bacterium]
MARVRTRDTAEELELRRALHRRGFRYRIHSSLPGRPDIVFSTRRIAVFVDGCFWHGCPLHYTAPRVNWEFWKKKVEENRERDVRSDAKLQSAGWAAIHVWQHELGPQLENTLERLSRLLEADSRVEQSAGG